MFPFLCSVHIQRGTKLIYQYSSHFHVLFRKNEQFIRLQVFSEQTQLSNINQPPDSIVDANAKRFVGERKTLIKTVTTFKYTYYTMQTLFFGHHYHYSF